MVPGRYIKDNINIMTYDTKTTGEPGDGREKQYTENAPQLSDEQFDRELFRLLDISRRIATVNSLELAANWMRAISKNTPSEIHSDIAHQAYEALFNLWIDAGGDVPAPMK